MSKPTDDATPPTEHAGARLKALREAFVLVPGRQGLAGLTRRTPSEPKVLTQDQLSELTHAAADRSGGRLKGLGRTYIVNIEAGRNDAQTDRVRGVYAAVFDLTRDQLADYLDGVVELDALLGTRTTKPPSTSRPPVVGIPTAGSHPRWAELVEEVRRAEPHITRETFEIVGASPFPYGPIEKIDAYTLAKVCTMVQSFRSR